MIAANVVQEKWVLEVMMIGEEKWLAGGDPLYVERRGSFDFFLLPGLFYSVCARGNLLLGSAKIGVETRRATDGPRGRDYYYVSVIYPNASILSHVQFYTSYPFESPLILSFPHYFRRLLVNINGREDVESMIFNPGRTTEDSGTTAITTIQFPFATRELQQLSYSSLQSAATGANTLQTSHHCSITSRREQAELLYKYNIYKGERFAKSFKRLLSQAFPTRPNTREPP
jgi:hypothetical protein